MLTTSDRWIIRGTNSFFEYQKAQELFKGMATRQYVAVYLDYHLSTVNAVMDDWVSSSARLRGQLVGFVR
jgi:hypothetical protein